MKRGIVQVIIAAVIAVVSVIPPAFQKPVFPQPIEKPAGKCGDGICDEFEKVVLSYCLWECKEVIE